MRNHWLVPFSATCISGKIPASPGMPNYVCWRLPASFSITFLGFFIVNFLMLWSCSRILLIFPLAGTVCSPCHWRPSRIFLSRTPMFLPLCLFSSYRMNRLLRVDIFQRAEKYHKCHATCNVRGEEGVLAQNFLWHRWNRQQMPILYQQDCRHDCMKILWDHDRFKLMPGECGFSFTSSDMMSRAVSYPTLKKVVIYNIPFVMTLGQQVLPRLGIKVYRQWMVGHNRNSTLVDLIPLGTKNHWRCRAWKIERVSPGCGCLPWLRRGILVLSLFGPLTYVELFLLCRNSLILAIYMKA